MRFRKKPVEIEAHNFTNAASGRYIEQWSEGAARYHAGPTRVVTIDTPEGTMTANIGDWVIKGVEGEFYPCKPAIFKATYDKVEEDQ